MSKKALSQERFGRHAQAYVTSQDHAVGSDLDRLLELARPAPGWAVLDIATGGGHTALHFAPDVARVIASDLTLKMLEAARAFISGRGVKNIQFSAAEAENLPFASATFDLVTCRIAPHHFTDCARFVGEAARLLKPGGLLLVQDHLLPEAAAAAEYLEEFERLRDPSHHQAFSQAGWIGMYQAAGLAIEHTERVGKRHQFVPWVERQGCPPEVVARLEELLRLAPPAAADWMQPQQVGTPEASFANQHLIILGRKPFFQD
jgi:ubiquinone/menaquinone biosynthesis C-methylase UbiE